MASTVLRKTGNSFLLFLNLAIQIFALLDLSFHHFTFQWPVRAKADLFAQCIYVVRKPLITHLILSLQISAEFLHLVSTELHRSFFDGLDKYVPRLLELYKV